MPLDSLRGRRSKGRGKEIRAPDHARDDSNKFKKSYVKLINACMSSDASEKKDVAKQK